MNEDKQTADFIKKRDAMLMKDDVHKFILFMTKYGMPMPSSFHMVEVAMHKTRTAIPGLPMEIRSESKRWLIKRGFHSLDDGDIPNG